MIAGRWQVIVTRKLCRKLNNFYWNKIKITTKHNNTNTNMLPCLRQLLLVWMWSKEDSDGIEADSSSSINCQRWRWLSAGWFRARLKRVLSLAWRIVCYLHLLCFCTVTNCFDRKKKNRGHQVHRHHVLLNWYLFNYL